MLKTGTQPIATSANATFPCNRFASAKEQKKAMRNNQQT